jgi:hypothetical protein
MRVRSPRVALAVGCVAALLAGTAIASQRSAAAMAAAASAFLNGLSPEQRRQASLGFDDERLRWHYIPTEAFPRRGLTLKAMDDAQRKLAKALLRSGLSQTGYLTATSIMELETVLGALEQQARDQGRRAENFRRDPERYYFSVFGTPGSQGAWGWKVEGHHVSLNFTVVEGAMVASSPSFFGSNPAEVREGPQKGLRILAAEEDTARALLASLDDGQRKRAIIQDVAPNEILTSNTLDIDPLSPVGITADALAPEQRTLLMRVVEAYTSAMADDVAADRLGALRAAGIERVAFAWAGPVDRGARHYYRVQGPTFLIEYDNTQNDGNHIHSVWRDFDGDFGRDLLREHVRTVAH